MKEVCYIVEMNSALEGLFEQLNDYGIDYYVDESMVSPTCLEVILQCVEGEFAYIERLFAPYV